MPGQNLGSGNNNAGSGNAGGGMAADAVVLDANGVPMVESGEGDSVNAVPSEADINSMVQKMVSEQLAPMKANVDKAYGERDAVNTELAKLREDAKAAEIQRLTDEGKGEEVLQLRLSELQGKYDAVVGQNTKLSRDQLVVNATEGLSFKNESAKRMAMDDIIADLVQNAEGQWVHKSGASVKDAVDLYAKDGDKSFLFVPKNSSGASTVQAGVGVNTDVSGKEPFMTKAVSELNNEEMIQAQLAGRFGEIPQTGMFGL